MKRILHIAPQNFAGMPMDFVKMQREAGHEARLVTIFKNTLSFDEDITLGFSLPTGGAARKWRDLKMSGLKYYEPKNIAESLFFKARDFRNSAVIEKLVQEEKLLEYDVYHFDGGMDFYRDIRFAKKLLAAGKKIVCCYFGSDLRSRGIFRELDEMSSLNLTVEQDHLSLHKNINYLFFPFDVKGCEFKVVKNKKLRIIHSPTNRKFKGTDKILEVIEQVKKERDIEFILAENMDRTELLELKQTCDAAIDQVGGELGGSGYGKNSIENLAMGLPTITEFTEEYLKFLPGNPFISVNINTLKDAITEITDNRQLLEDYAHKGRAWAEKYHSFEAVNSKLEELYVKHSINQFD